jgi:starvation-inducible outer membrane lipoprotein
MNAARCTQLAIISLMIAACATRPAARDAIAHVNPASVAAAPAEWDGREIEMVGFLVWEFENQALYQSYGAYCRGAEKAAIYVQWSHWPGVTRKDSRRRVVVRGTFRNKAGVPQPGGSILISNAAPGPGPLEPGHVVRWLSRPLKPCPRALP